LKYMMSILSILVLWACLMVAVLMTASCSAGGLQDVKSISISSAGRPDKAVERTDFSADIMRMMQQIDNFRLDIEQKELEISDLTDKNKALINRLASQHECEPSVKTEVKTEVKEVEYIPWWMWAALGIAIIL